MKYPILSYPHAITRENIGDLLAWHRAVFGATRMEDDDADGDSTDDADGDSTDDDSDDDAGDSGDGAESLGDKGKQALDRMKAKLRDERAKRRAAEAKAAARNDNDNDNRARREAEAAATKKANARILRSEIKAAAAGKLADPADAYQFLDLDKFEVDDDGNVDEEEIADAIDDLIKKKPYLSAQGGKRFGGESDGGRKGDRKKSQLTREDLKGMSPTEILTAQKEGRLADLIKG